MTVPTEAGVRRAYGAGLAATLGCGLSCWAFFPGYMSYDSAEQLWQARLGQFHDVQPPLMAMFWRLLLPLSEGPAPMFGLLAALYWASLAGIAAHVARTRWRQILIVLLVGLWLPGWILLGHVWKDVALFVLLLATTALLCRAERRISIAILALAVLTMAGAAALRHNALPALLPFVLAYAALGVRRYASGKRPARIALVGAALLALVYLLAGLPARLPGVQHRDMWPALAVQDLASISLAQRRWILPETLRDPTLTFDELALHYQPYSTSNIFFSGKLRNSFLEDLSAADKQTLRAAWLALPWTEPAAYWRHRSGLAALQFGWRDAAIPEHQYIQPIEFQLRDNPTIPANSSALNGVVLSAVRATLATPLFAGLSYVVLAVLLLLFAWRHPERPGVSLVRILCVSALLYVLPLLLVAGSAEFRYLGWLVVAVPLAAAVWVFAASPPVQKA